MHDGGRLSAEEKGKQKSADDAADQLPPALVLEEGEGEPRPAGDDAAANWQAGGGSGVRRCLFLGPAQTSAESEIEELPPSPPPPAPSHSHLPELNVEEQAAGLAAARMAAVAVLVGRMKVLEEALDSRLRELEQVRRGSEGSKGGEASKRRRDGADDEPKVAGGGAEVQMLQNHLGTMQGRVSGIKDAMLALRLQREEFQTLEEFWKPVVPTAAVPQRQQRNYSKAKLEKMKALEEFWKPVVPVPQRNNSKRKINWEPIIWLIAFTSGLVSYISFWTRLPVNNLTHIVGTISVLWILRSTYSCCQRFRTSRTISRHVPRLIYVCFWLLVLYVSYLILRPLHGTFAGLLANISRGP